VFMGVPECQMRKVFLPVSFLRLIALLAYSKSAENRFQLVSNLQYRFLEFHTKGTYATLLSERMFLFVVPS